ncbi:TcpQ domain-containing protein [Cupriavidus sp. TMH.W2]|uniref:TcpQ domain-containing protein n=1 Tax=Cupriavidus sp. TMH.W2 TaxID=3434465 RepID=UPI003D76D4C8
MPLADSLIAQFVPIVGPIRLEGDSSLFQTPVAIPQGLARSAALRAVAERAGVVVRLKGNVVSVEPMRVAPMGIAEQMGAAGQALTPSPSLALAYQAVPPAPIPAAIPAPKPAFDPAPIERWVSQSDKGMTLKQVIKEWAERNGQWKLRWNASNDYPAPDMEWNGDFLEAVDRTLAPYGRIKRPIEPVLHRDGGQQILEIADKRN